MNGNDLSLGLNHATADRATLTSGSDWHRVELHWNNGAMISEVHDTRDEAIEHLRRLGWDAV